MGWQAGGGCWLQAGKGSMLGCCVFQDAGDERGHRVSLEVGGVGREGSLRHRANPLHTCIVMGSVLAEQSGQL